jgi:hypothetical protein
MTEIAQLVADDIAAAQAADSLPEVNEKN